MLGAIMSAVKKSAKTKPNMALDDAEVLANLHQQIEALDDEIAAVSTKTGRSRDLLADVDDRLRELAVRIERGESRRKYDAEAARRAELLPLLEIGEKAILSLNGDRERLDHERVIVAARVEESRRKAVADAAVAQCDADEAAVVTLAAEWDADQIEAVRKTVAFLTAFDAHRASAKAIGRPTASMVPLRAVLATHWCVEPIMGYTGATTIELSVSHSAAHNRPTLSSVVGHLKKDTK